MERVPNWQLWGVFILAPLTIVGNVVALWFKFSQVLTNGWSKALAFDVVMKCVMLFFCGFLLIVSLRYREQITKTDD